MERDDVSSRTMVLCVSNVSVSENESESAAQETNDQDGETDGRGNVKKAEVSSAYSICRVTFPLVWKVIWIFFFMVSLYYTFCVRVSLLSKSGSTDHGL